VYLIIIYRRQTVIMRSRTCLWRTWTTSEYSVIGAKVGRYLAYLLPGYVMAVTYYFSSADCGAVKTVYRAVSGQKSKKNRNPPAKGWGRRYNISSSDELSSCRERGRWWRRDDTAGRLNGAADDDDESTRIAVV